MEETHHLEQPCEICGSVGYGELISTCNKCEVTREHVYCKRINETTVPEEWICDECLVDKSRCDIVDHDVVTQGALTKVCDDVGKLHHLVKRQKHVETGKVKFISINEVVKLASGAKKLGYPSKTNSEYRHGVSSVTPKLVPMGVKRNPQVISSVLKKPPRHGAPEQMDTIIPAKERIRKVTFCPVKESFFKDQKMTSIKPSEPVRKCIINLIAKEAKTCNTNIEEDVKKSLGKSSIPANSPLVIAKEAKICNTNIEEDVKKSLGKSAILANSPIMIDKRAPTTLIVDHSCKEVNAVVPTEKVEAVYAASTKNPTNRASCNPPSLKLSLPSYVSGKALYLCCSDSCPIDESEKSYVQLRNLASIRPKLSLYRHYFPVLESTWKGGFKFFDTSSPGKFYGGFQAQPPRIVNRQAYEFSQLMPTILKVTLLPLQKIWIDLFQNEAPDFHDIALYFLPSPVIQRSKENHGSLVKLLETENSALRSYIDDVELIIFTSKQLHPDLEDVIQMLSTGQFLWGVFRDGRG